MSIHSLQYQNWLALNKPVFADGELHSGSYIVTTTMYIAAAITDMLGVISSPVAL